MKLTLQSRLIFVLFLCIPILLMGQKRDLNYLHKDDTVTIKLNKYDYELRSRALSSYIFNSIVSSFVAYDNEFTKDSHQGSLSDFSISIELKNGLSWEIFNPPKRPSFFFFKFLFSSKNDKFIDGLDYEFFMGVWESRTELPYEVIERFIVERSVYTMKKETLISTEKFELIPDSEGGLEIKALETNTILNAS